MVSKNHTDEKDSGITVGKTVCFVIVSNKSFINFGHNWTVRGSVGIIAVHRGGIIFSVNKTL